MGFDQGMRRLAIVIGVLGAIVGGLHAYKLLRNVPSERYQHKIYENLTTAQVVKRDQALLLAARKDGIVFWYPLATYVGDPHARKLDVVGQDDSAHEVAYETLEERYADMIGPELRQPTASNGIRVIFWKPDLTVDFFDMQGGGYVPSEPSPSAWQYLFWIVYPVLGFAVVWGVVRGIGWVLLGFCPALKSTCPK